MKLRRLDRGRRDGPPSGEFRTASQVDGVERFFSYRKLQNYPLTIYIGQGVDTVLAPYYRQRRPAAGRRAALATVLVLMVALLLVARARERARYLEERERVMLELHDSSIQSIYAIGLTLENSRRLVEKDPAQAVRTLADAGANLNLVIQDLRAFITRERRSALSEQEFMLEIERMIPPPEQGAPRFSVDVDRRLIAALSPTRPATCCAWRARRSATSCATPRRAMRASRSSSATRTRPARDDATTASASAAQRSRGSASACITSRHGRASCAARRVSTPARPAARASSSNSRCGDER